jgi:hypothetical protein
LESHKALPNEELVEGRLRQVRPVTDEPNPFYHEVFILQKSTNLFIIFNNTIRKFKSNKKLQKNL